MLLSCNQGCKKSDGMTEGSIDIDSDKVICNKCGDEMRNVNSFTKRGMKSNNDVIKKSPKAFLFDCLTCKKKVDTESANGILRGKGCNNSCKFNISRFMINTIENIEDENEDENNE